MNPSLVRHMLYPAYRFIKQDDIYERLKELEKNQWLSRQELEELQWTKLKNLLFHVYKNVPYYTQLFKDLDIRPEDIQGPGDFAKIPILTKEIIRGHGNKMISTDSSASGIHANTGGSTGETLYFQKDKAASGYGAANIIRINKWCGKEIGDKEAVFWGTAFDISKVSKFNDMIKQYMQNIIYFSTFDMSEMKMFEYAKKLSRFKPRIIRGYPSALYTFANFLKKNNISDIRPSAVISTGEKSFSFQKEMMEEVFKCKVYERYGSNEFGNIAHECSERHGLHILNDMYYVEVLKDNRPAEYGEVGEIFVTNLQNYYMPFLRYKIGDMGVLSDKQCSCGRGFPMLEEVKGRTFDKIVTPSGKTLGGFFWTFVSRAVPGIRQFQVVQKEKSGIDFKIVPDNTFNEGSKKLLEKEIKEKAGQDFKVNFEVVDEIPLTPSGKSRFIISEVSSERLVMKSKIHKAVVTDVDPDSPDSITVDEDLMKMVNLKEYEKVLIVDNTNGARLETFVVKGKRGSRIISVNGAGVHLINKNDEIIIMGFTWTGEILVPSVILVDENNEFVEYLEGGRF